jgi:hypothetical protein
LRRKFARLKGSWENLLQSTLDYDEPVVFAELAELVEVTETAMDEALFGSEDLLQQLMDRDLCDGIGVDDTDSVPRGGDTSESEDDDIDSPLRHGVDDVEGSSMTEEDFLWTDCDTADDEEGPEENKDSPTAVTNAVAGEVEAETLSGHCMCIVARGKVVDNSVSDVGRETYSSGAGHRGGGLDDDELEGLERLETAFRGTQEPHDQGVERCDGPGGRRVGLHQNKYAHESGQGGG